METSEQKTQLGQAQPIVMMQQPQPVMMIPVVMAQAPELEQEGGIPGKWRSKLGACCVNGKCSECCCVFGFSFFPAAQLSERVALAPYFAVLPILVLCAIARVFVIIEAEIEYPWVSNASTSAEWFANICHAIFVYVVGPYLKGIMLFFLPTLLYKTPDQVNVFIVTENWYDFTIESLSFVLYFALVLIVRMKVQKIHQIPNGNVIKDIAIAWFCTPCALSQLVHQTQVYLNRKRDLGPVPVADEFTS